MRNLSAWSLFLLLGATAMLLCGPRAAQAQGKGKGKDDGKTKALPNDPELMSLHRDFVQKAEKLAGKYEKDKNWSQAKDCYEEILKLVPQYPSAQQKVKDLLQLESVAQSTTLTLAANEKWKDTGVVLLEDRPVTIRASGTWTFRLTSPVSADGLKIPEELREFDPGCLVGLIVPPDTQDLKELKPFMIGVEKQLIAPKTGKLLVQIYDNDVRDNEGELTIEIRGTFQGGSESKPKSKGKK